MSQMRVDLGQSSLEKKLRSCFCEAQSQLDLVIDRDFLPWIVTHRPGVYAELRYACNALIAAWTRALDDQKAEPFIFALKRWRSQILDTHCLYLEYAYGEKVEQTWEGLL